MSKYRSICNDLDQDLKQAAYKIKNEQQTDFKISEKDKLKAAQEARSAKEKELLEKQLEQQ